MERTGLGIFDVSFFLMLFLCDHMIEKVVEALLDFTGHSKV